MAFIIGLLTLVMVLDCLIVILLVLIQLPKKDAGAGLAFGGSATDALFGAGSGTVLTKITKYAATGFFVLALILSILQSNYHRRAGSALSKSLAGQAPLSSGPMAAPGPAAAPASNVPTLIAPSNPVRPPAAESTDLPQAKTNPAATTTNPASAPANPK
jgi:preprotein translocase subunit SecG